MTGLPGMLVDADWLAGELGAPDLRILDCTSSITRVASGPDRVVPERAAFENGHIPGAQFVEVQRDLSDPDTPFRFMRPGAVRFGAAMARLGVGAGTRVVVYNTGNRLGMATRVWWLLRNYGFDAAAVLDGGWTAWNAGARPVEKGAARSFTAAAFDWRDRGLFADKGDVIAAQGDGTQIVNALPADQHAGTVSNFSRAGHIPGSLSLPTADLLAPDGRFLSPEDLKARVAEGGLTGTSPVVAYCGGGIAATVDAFALTRLGFPEVKVYDASLQEWAEDVDLPLDSDRR